MRTLVNHLMRVIRRNGLTHVIVVVGVLLFCGLMLSSCGNDDEVDGAWEPMKWKTDVSMNKDGDISAAAEGGAYIFNCTNYQHIWISEVEQVTSDGKKNVILKISRTETLIML